MSIFGRVLPWFIPTKDDQRKWYQEELKDNPKEILRLLGEFHHVNEQYNNAAAIFENEIQKSDLYGMYLDMRSKAQQASFLWNRIEYKRSRESDLKEMMRKLND